MCENCFLRGYHRFESYWVFDAFDSELKQKLSRGQLLAQPQGRFTCLNCETVWVISEPDNAWRGYFLPEAEVQAHLRRSQHSSKLGLVVAGLLVLLGLLRACKSLLQ
jgi:hypothetical protein